MKFGSGSEYKLEQLVDTRHVQSFRLDLNEHSSVVFKFYKHFLLINIAANPLEFADAVGLLGTFPNGEMQGRDGKLITDFTDFGFHWQVSPQDGQLFRDAREPQLPYEMCRLPTLGRPARRLRSDSVLVGQAETACGHLSGNDFELCVGDILATGDVGLAEHW